ncbi:MAG TPA: hypothetical protein VL242_14625, partial [Sorangium sp.]|nr:hypothetical protein [Sorangium sp.]
CLNLWTRSGPRVDADGRLVIEAAPADGDAFRSCRGGAWSSVENNCRAAGRLAGRPAQPRSTTGLRVARPYP